MSLAFPANNGPLSRQTAPLIRAGSDALKAIANVLGAGVKAFVFSPDQVRSTETFTLQRLAEGKAEYIGFSVTSAMQSSNAPILQLMPMLKTNTTSFIHEQFSFPKELAIATPAQAPPSYVEVEKRSREITLERYALGATTTVQELRTAEGQFIFRGKLITVAVGFIEVAELLAIDVLLTTPSLYAQYWVEAGQHPMDLARAGRRTDLYWDIMRQRDNGFAELVDMVRQEFTQQRIAPSHIIMTEGMRSLMMASPMKKEYSRNGPGAAQNAERLGDAVGDSFDGIQFIVVRPIEMRKKDLRIAPLERETIIGGHLRIDHFHEDCDLSRWCSKYYTIQFVSMGTNNWSALSPDDGLEYDGRFSHSDGRLSDHHYALVDDLENKARKSCVPIWKKQYDMFIYLSYDVDGGAPVANVCELWGHMEKWALKDETCDRTAITSANAMRRAINSQASIDAITAGLEDIRELHDRALTTDDVAFMRAPGVIGRTGTRVPTSRPPEAIRNAGNYAPAGHGTVGGYIELANTAGVPGYAYIDQNIVRRAVAFKKALVQMHAFYMSVYGPTHPALDPNNAPASYRAAIADGAQTAASTNMASVLAFGQNIVDNPKSFLYIAGAGGAAAPTVVALPASSIYSGFNEWFNDLGAPPLIAEAFGSSDRVTRFEQQFENSTFARRYQAYVEDQRAAARRTRGAAAALSSDAEPTEAFGGAAGGTALARFHKREVEDAQLAPEQVFALYSRVIESVRSNRAPTTVDANLLRAWASDRGAAQRDTLQQADLPADARLSGYSVSIDALRNSVAEARGDADEGVAAGVLFASPLNPGRAVDLSAAGAELDGSGANTDLLRTTLVSQARAAPVPGSRAPPPVARTAAEQSIFGGIGGSVPSYAQNAFTDVVGNRVVVNTNIRDRYARFGAEANWMLRVAGQMFLLAPITKQVLQAFKKHDIAMPVAWLIEMFNRRYTTASMIFVSKPTDRDFGNVRYMDADTHIGRNAVNKNLMVHVSMYMGATADDVQDWFVAHDVAVVGYSGGENSKAFDYRTWNLNSLDKLPIDGPSLLWYMEPAGSLVGKDENKVEFTHDIRGFSDPMHYKNASVHRESQFSERPQHPSALFYTTLLELNRLVTPTSEDWHRFHRREGTFNTVTHQMLQRVINPHTHNHDLVILANDPFGIKTYPGQRELRESALPRVYEPTEYRTVAIAI